MRSKKEKPPSGEYWAGFIFVAGIRLRSPRPLLTLYYRFSRFSIFNAQVADFETPSRTLSIREWRSIV
jgi:hypothetical protein